MKSEMVACDNPDCTNKAALPQYQVHHPDWYVVFGPGGRVDVCSPACMSMLFRPFVQAKEIAQ